MALNLSKVLSSYDAQYFKSGIDFFSKEGDPLQFKQLLKKLRFYVLNVWIIY